MLSRASHNAENVNGKCRVMFLSLWFEALPSYAWNQGINFENKPCMKSIKSPNDASISNNHNVCRHVSINVSQYQISLVFTKKAGTVFETVTPPYAKLQHCRYLKAPGLA